ncbi:pentapeptide repeat-containing protein [Pseudoalteromonas sp. P1-11]|uniref:pentapeptide repeat-containing protein n=1 Tax=Pseudoalteromonas sp. P1-11 TaxID=1715254 RepID=UPI0006DC23D5|nr:pentapeptide repeat-containing protein [Pseudoalteromonas sp. P1-11]KPW01827.1 hypothetical protein AN390_02216 [Pseudoalteromonas sp. P1-11]
MEFKKPNLLSKEASVALWLQGKDAWNVWAKNNPDIGVDFSGVRFAIPDLLQIAPNNKVLLKANAEGDISALTFVNYTFPHLADFSNTEFNIPAIFDNGTFNGTADFSKAIFSQNASFNGITFNCIASFYNAEFQNSIVFSDCNFKGNTLFTFSHFEMLAYFPSTTFHEVVGFDHSTFAGGTHFKNTKFLCKEVYFEYINCTDTFDFDELDAKKVITLSFKGSVFEKDFNISGHFKCVPDLRSTKLNHHTDLTSMIYTLNRKKVFFTPIKKVTDTLDIGRLCRLKELAEQNKSHDMALAFHADELRAKRWGRLNIVQSVMDIIYSVTSNYGQSIMRPLLLLVISFLLFNSYVISKSDIEIKSAYKPAATLSIATITPFLSISKEARGHSAQVLFEKQLPENFYLYSYAYASSSFLFLFLVGLGLRNRFRI